MQQTTLLCLYLKISPSISEVLFVADEVLPLNNNGDCVRARIPLADTGFFTLELGGVTTEKGDNIH